MLPVLKRNSSDGVCYETFSNKSWIIRGQKSLRYLRSQFSEHGRRYLLYICNKTSTLKYKILKRYLKMDNIKKNIQKGAALFHDPSHNCIKRLTIRFQESHCFDHGTFVSSKIRGWYSINILLFAQQNCLKLTKMLAGFSFYPSFRNLLFIFIFSFVFLP